MSKMDTEESKIGSEITNEHIELSTPLSKQAQLEQDFSDINKRRFLWKVDLNLIPWLCVLYCVLWLFFGGSLKLLIWLYHLVLSFLDRTAIGNAKLYGLEEDIGASDLQYRIGLTLFFIPYALFEPLTNSLLKQFRPSIFLSSIILAWGSVLTLSGIIQNPAGLYATRFFLGVTEAALYPGVNFFLSCWYKRSEFGLRAAVFFSAASASGAFGGLLSVAIAQMGGIQGYNGWRWIFIILGLLSVACSLASFWLTHDYPHQAKFLTPREREYAVARLQADDQYSASGEPFQWKYVRDALTDYKTYGFMMVYAGACMPLYAVSLAMPTIIHELGFNTATSANLLAVPCYVWACIVTSLVGFASDRTGYRCFYHFVFAALGMVGFILMISEISFSVSYGAIYLAAMGIFPLISNTVSWAQNNIEGQHKRAISAGLIIGFGNINGAVSSNVYRAQDKPWFRLGHGMVLMYIALGYVAAIIMFFCLRRENRRKEAGHHREIITPGQPSDPKNNTFASDHEARLALGDRYSGFRYRY